MGAEAVVWAQLEQAEATIRHAKEAVQQMAGFHDEKAEARILAKVDDLGERIDVLLEENARLRAALAQAEARAKHNEDVARALWEEASAAEARAARYEKAMEQAAEDLRDCRGRDGWYCRAESAADDLTAALAPAPRDPPRPEGTRGAG